MIVALFLFLSADDNLESFFIRNLDKAVSAAAVCKLPMTALFKGVSDTDYALDRDQTHYLRIAHTGRSTTANRIDSKELEALLRIVQERKQAQEAWYAMAIKVPDHAPWAPHGYARLMEQYTAADSLNRAIEGDILSEELIINYQLAIVNLSAAINSMRPGNLAEPEDLTELLSLITHAKQQGPRHNNSLQKAIKYANMTVNYVGDGSGTHDMIEKATIRLKAELKNKQE